MKGISIRRAARDDLPALEAALFEAIHWNASDRRLELDAYRASPGFGDSLGGWGERRGDAAVIAEAQGTPIGAAWRRFWTAENHSWGYIDDETPEVGIGVAAEWRGRGVGRALLVALIVDAREAGVGALSLSVAPENFAIQLYRSLGFVDAGASGTSLTLRKQLSSDVAGGGAGH